jgi:hypothetical protein
MVDLGHPVDVERIDLFLGRQCSSYPRNFVILASLDGHSWKYVLRQKGTVPLESYLSDPRNPVFTIQFNPINARFLSIVLAGGGTECFWYIAEIKIYGSRGEPNSESRGLEYGVITQQYRKLFRYHHYEREKGNDTHDPELGAADYCNGNLPEHMGADPR